MKKVQERTTSRIPWRPLIGLLAVIVVMSVVVLSGQELKHVPPAAPSFTVLYEFAGYPTDGAGPVGGLIRDAAGDLYGTTLVGGASGGGVVFKLAPTGTETVLYSFTGGADGEFPQAGLVRDAAGNLYGTTSQRGSSACGVGCGTVFKLSLIGTETVLYSFTGGADGATPYAGLIPDTAGNLYGTTYSGGAHGKGVVFELIRCSSVASGYEYKVLYSFTGGADGGNPDAALLRDAAGNLYGTAAYGGAGNAGVVFKLSPTGSETVLHSFSGADGALPHAGLVRDTAGNLYGTTLVGGAATGTCNPPYGCGVVFKLSPTGTETVLHSFTGGADGANPYAGLAQDAAGNLYGTAAGGGISNAGVVFKLTPTGTETVLHTFTGGADGSIPVAGLIQDAAGNLYGTAAAGGIGFPVQAGVVFRLTPN
jgi:uncharacterized repeat protein (TIGR03803 family)